MIDCLCEAVRTRKLLGLFRWHSSQMSQIALVPHQHDHNIGVGVVSKFLQPPSNIVVCLVLANIIDKQRADRSPVVCGCDRAISFLACCVPYLCLDRLRVDLDGSRCKLDSDRRL